METTVSENEVASTYATTTSPKSLTVGLLASNTSMMFQTYQFSRFKPENLNHLALSEEGENVYDHMTLPSFPRHKQANTYQVRLVPDVLMCNALQSRIHHFMVQWNSLKRPSSSTVHGWNLLDKLKHPDNVWQLRIHFPMTTENNMSPPKATSWIS